MGESNTNLKLRVIPVILVHNMQIVKSRGFSDYRVVGNLEQTIEVFNRRKVDEIIVLDIGASKGNLGVNLNILKLISRNTLMPLSYGGGITSLKDIERCLSSGCDKVIINCQAFSNRKLIKDAVDAFGSQAIVASVDYKLVDKEYKIYNHVEHDVHQSNFVDYINNILSAGVGELVLSSVDADGKLSGYDIGILDCLPEMNIPILINGGCGAPIHMKNAFKNKISGCCAGSIFYFTEYGYRDIKEYLTSNNVRVRIG
jgi:imidazole glycerol-phosphate synthase subunit HisF